MPNLAVLVSGGGTNLQAIIDAIATKGLDCQISSVIADRNCFALERAQRANIPHELLDRKLYAAKLSSAIDSCLKDSCDLVVLAGFLSILDSDFIAKWQGKIINLHPSLLPKHGGAGMWGLRVHQAVIAAGDRQSGCSVHYVNNQIDGGEIILQAKLVVDLEDTALSLQQKVQTLESNALITAIRQVLHLPCNV